MIYYYITISIQHNIELLYILFIIIHRTRTLGVRIELSNEIYERLHGVGQGIVTAWGQLVQRYLAYQRLQGDENVVPIVFA